MSDRLLALAAANNGIIASQDVHHADVDPHALAALLRAGVLRRVRGCTDRCGCCVWGACC